MTAAVSALALLPLMFLFSPCRPPPYVESFSFIFFLLFFHSRPAAAQPVTPKKEHYLLFGFNPSMIITIVLLIAALIFLAFFFIYIRNCHGLNSNRIAVRRVNDEFRRHRYKMRGLNASVIETFPTMVYSEVKAHKIGKVALECAVCLNEFEDDDKLRLIPKCDHIFHPECIDVWLACHTTCPVCRADLDSQPSEHLSQPSESDNTVTELHNEA